MRTEKTENTVLTVSATVNAAADVVWKLWTSPVHITKWNNASADWHTPKAENDLRVGGKFLSRMEARDGSMGFDFWGTYMAIEPNRLIESVLGDGRKVKVVFNGNGSHTNIVESFEAETINSLELQQTGWQAILDNFKKYAEDKENFSIDEAIYPCLWFNGNAREAADFYCSVFKNSKILVDSGLVVTFELDGKKLMGLNGGPEYKFNAAVSFVISCERQEDIDYHWNKLGDGGVENQCGWLTDKFGVSWQIIPSVLPVLMSDPAKAARVTNAFMQMRKLDIQTLIEA